MWQGFEEGLRRISKQHTARIGWVGKERRGACMRDFLS